MQEVVEVIKEEFAGILEKHKSLGIQVRPLTSRTYSVQLRYSIQQYRQCLVLYKDISTSSYLKVNTKKAF